VWVCWTVLAEVPDVPAIASADREVELADWSKPVEDERTINRIILY